jgi:GT2 family glycosyltransferase
MFRISVIIATMNRREKLLHCIHSVVSQTFPPCEIVIVDDGELDPEEIRRSIPSAIQFQYHRKHPPGLSASRNLGAGVARGELLLFLDDDVVLEKDYIEQIVKVFENDGAGEIGGVCGIIMNRRGKPGFFHLWARAFMLESAHEGKVLPWGFYTKILNPRQTMDVDWIPGGLSCFRREVFEEFQLSDMGHLGRHGLADVEFSCRIKKRYRLLVTPFARLWHYPPRRSRKGAFEAGYKQAVGHRQIFVLHGKKTPLNRLRFWWAMAGLVMGNLGSMLFMRDPDERKARLLMALGNLKGIFWFLNKGVRLQA